MLTLTLSHGWGDSLEELRRGLTTAWGRTIAGEPWQRIAQRWGIVGYVRALELTDGPNGWHPHLHLLLFTMRPVGELEPLRERLGQRWAARVRSVLGERHEPRTDEVGCDLRPSRSADYLAAMGLEITGQLSKEGRNGHHTPWELIDHDPRRWRAYVRGIRGARMLQWSQGLRAALLGDVATDQEHAIPETVATVASLPQAIWDDMVRAGHELELLEAAETGPDAVVQRVRARLGLEAAELAASSTARALERDAARRALEALRRQRGRPAEESRWTGIGALG